VASLDYLAGLFDGEGSFSIQVGIRKSRVASNAAGAWLCPSMSVNLAVRDYLDMIGVGDHDW
jgi:hypothetical protein